MAALGKIRSRGAILICIIGLGLFAFIAGDLFRSCEGTKAEQSQRLAVIAGEKVNAQVYQKYAEQFVEFQKMEGAQASDEQLREAAWNNYLQEQLIAAEAAKIGLVVTDEEVNDVMTKGIHPVLANFPIPQVHNQQTGLFDVNAYRQLVNSTKQAANQQSEQIYNYLLYKENQLRMALLFEKFSNLIQACSISNPVEAKFAFDTEKKESDIIRAAFDYKAINDNDVQVADADIKKKYDELKEGAQIKLNEEVRTGKIIFVQKVASDGDKAELDATLREATAKLDSVPGQIDSLRHCVREFDSDILYSGVPVTKNAFTPAVANMVDSVALNVAKGPFLDAADNTMNVIRVISKNTLPDSIQFRTIGIPADNLSDAATRADSIVKAIQGGEDFDVMAKKYGSDGEKAWMTTSQYERAANIDAEQATLISTLHTAAVNDLKVLDISGGKLIVQVLAQKKPVQKYVVAQIKREINYSTETSRQYNEKMRLFLADNRNIESIEKNAPQNNYQVVDIRGQQGIGLSPSANGIPGLDGSKDAFRWLFNSDRKVGDVSETFECGDKNTVLMALVITGIYDKGYRPLDDAAVNEYVKQQALNDKKAEKIIEATKSVSSIDAAKAVAGLTCRIDTVQHVSFANYNQEPKLAGAVAASKPGFNKTPVKGNNGVYFFQVTEQRTLEGTYDEKEYKARAAQRNLSVLQSLFGDELMRNAKITDNRYIFM